MPKWKSIKFKYFIYKKYIKYENRKRVINKTKRIVS
jgi:hypothetical protein